MKKAVRLPSTCSGRPIASALRQGQCPSGGMVDAGDSKSPAFAGVPVRVRPWVPGFSPIQEEFPAMRVAGGTLPESGRESQNVAYFRRPRTSLRGFSRIGSVARTYNVRDVAEIYARLMPRRAGCFVSKSQTIRAVSAAQSARMALNPLKNWKQSGKFWRRR